MDVEGDDLQVGLSPMSFRKPRADEILESCEQDGDRAAGVHVLVLSADLGRRAGARVSPAVAIA